MAFDFSNLDVLVADSDDVIRSKIVAALRIHNIRNVYEAFDGDTAFEFIETQKPHVVVTGLDIGDQDSDWLVRKLRKSDKALRETPVILLTGRKNGLSVRDLRDAGFTELLFSPFTVDAVARLITYVANNKRSFIECDTYTGPDRRRINDPSYEGPDRRKAVNQETSVPKDTVNTMPDLSLWPSHEKGREMVETLFDHYITHHELVERQLRFAQKATKEGIKKQEEVALQSASHMVGLQGFDAIWEEIIDLFRCGGVSEAELFKIEKIIHTMPRDIRGAFDSICGADNDYNQLHRSLDTEGYNSAKAIAQELEKKPNPMSGLTQEDYEQNGVEHRAQPVEGEVSVISLDPKTGRYKSAS